jgi:hypothetical protein
MSRALKLGCALVVLGCVALVAYYGLNRGIYIGSNVQPVASGPNVFWIKTCRYFSLSGGTYVRGVSDGNWRNEQASHDNADKTWCGLFAPKDIVIVR